MSVFGIVAEWNPLHDGHVRLIEEAKRLGAEAVVAVMSGHAVQRGMPALADRYSRAEAAVRSGVDLVLELPFPYCAAGAEFFASGALQVLSPYATDLIFGSECGDLSALERASALCSTPECDRAYRERIADEGCAGAYFSLLQEQTGFSLGSNDTLGVAYLNANRTLPSPLSAHTLRRTGSSYRSEQIEENASSTALRAMLARGEQSALASHMPPSAFDRLCRDQKNGMLTHEDRFWETALTFYRLQRADTLADIADADGGIADRLCTMAHKAATGKEYAALLSTKRYTDARLRRAVLFGMTGVTMADLRRTPTHTRLLAANETGRAILSARRKQEGILPVITKPADVPKDRQAALSDRMDAIFSLCLTSRRPTGHWQKAMPYIEGQ